MKKTFILAGLLYFFCQTAFSQKLSTLEYPENNSQALLVNPVGRNHISLNGSWKYIIDWYNYGFEHGLYKNKQTGNRWERVEYNFDKADQLFVPGDWNSQKPELLWYENTIWYAKKFQQTDILPSKKYWIYFAGVNYKADIFLNGKYIGRHEGGFTPFNFEITESLQKGENFLAVQVSNRREKDAVPTLMTDWWNYGGITRDVLLISTEKTYVENYVIQLSKSKKELIEVNIQLKGEVVENQLVTIEIPELSIKQNIKTDATGKASISITAKKLITWSPENPKLYEVIIGLNKEKIHDKIGFRTIETKGTDIVLNGKSIWLKGICIHEENPLKGGRVSTEAEARMLLQWAKELGCNFVRLAHYPHSEKMVQIADEMGLMVWAEIPVYWGIDWKNKRSYELAQQQLTEMILRDRNRAGIIIWSMANETMISDDRNAFIKGLIDSTRALDNSRLVSAALLLNEEKSTGTYKYIEDPLGKYTDLIAVNQYVGWYDGLPDKLDEVKFETIYKDKPLFFSEFGAGALHGLRGDSLTIWTEDYQAWLYTQTLKMADRLPQLKGFSPWVLADFRSPRRYLSNVQDYWNRKGVISQSGQKKQAFFILKSYYKNK